MTGFEHSRYKMLVHFEEFYLTGGIQLRLLQSLLFAAKRDSMSLQDKDIHLPIITLFIFFLKSRYREIFEKARNRRRV